VSKRLIVAVVGIVALVFALGLARGEAVLEMLLAALALAVAAIPTGLPTVVTLALAVGVQRMARRHALVRRMAAVETLGSAQVICSDKTGTLTMGELTVRRLWMPDAAFRVTGEGYAPEGRVVPEGPAAPGGDPEGAVRRLLYAAVACNDAELTTEHGRAAVIGDPTEGALLVAAAKAGIHRAEVERAHPRAFALPFDSGRKRMTVARVGNGGSTAFVKGAPDVVLDLCTRAATGSGDVPLDEAVRRRILEATGAFAGQALRVLALAERRLPDHLAAGGQPPGDVERDLTFLGLAALHDPPRPEARDAVRRCQAAGIRVVMITGDHPATGAAVARELGILRAGNANGVSANGACEVVNGPDLDRMDDEALLGAVRTAAVYARVTPEHKLRIVRAFRRAGLVVAMTGDGVNDAPAVKEASVGVAMGRSGTEVTRQAADIVVTDDNFASIVNAVEEGRRIFDNLQKTLLYLLAGNTGEILIMLVAGLAGWPLPLLPAQILWINFVTDHPPGLSLATEPVDPEALSRPPRPPGAEFADRRFLRRLVLAGSLIAAVSLAGFWHGYRVDHDVAAGRSLAFAVLAASHTTWAFAARSWTRTFWEAGPLTNLRLLAVVVATLAVQVAIQTTPALAWVFGTVPLTAGDWALAVGLGLLPVLVVEITKLAGRA
jgi:Ca2+-transporting ATPase